MISVFVYFSKLHFDLALEVLLMLQLITETGVSSIYEISTSKDELIFKLEEPRLEQLFGSRSTISRWSLGGRDETEG
jgi:hypothetical protein